MAKLITIAIPTHNRAGSIRETMRSIFALAVPPGAALECVVIDNASTDATASFVDAAAKSAPFPTRRVRESRLGSSFARNRAVDVADGDFIFFIDDDAIAEPAWAIEMLSAIEKRELDAACGMVLPRWSVAPPPWLGPSLWVKLAVHDRSALEAAPAQQIETLQNYFSANAGFRSSAFERFGRFREDLGVVGGNPISGEDTELFARIIDRGGKMGFAPRAVVHHLIGPERMTAEYLRGKSFAYGFGSAIAGGKSHNALDKLGRNLLRMAGAALRRDRERVVYHQLECANFFGYWRGRLSRRRS